MTFGQGEVCMKHKYILCLDLGLIPKVYYMCKYSEIWKKNSVSETIPLS